jgi:hypothetical protein
MRAVGGVRSRRSKTTRNQRPCPHTSRAVRTGSSASSVPDPIPMAATSARTRCAVPLRRRAADRRPRSRRRGHRAVEAHRDLGDDERAARDDVGHEHLVEALRLGLADADLDLDAVLAQIAEARGRRPPETDPASPPRHGGFRPPATATAHGPVRPVWLHGSSVQ